MQAFPHFSLASDQCLDQNAGHGDHFYLFLDLCEGGMDKQCLKIVCRADSQS